MQFYSNAEIRIRFGSFADSVEMLLDKKAEGTEGAVGAFERAVVV